MTVPFRLRKQWQSLTGFLQVCHLLCSTPQQMYLQELLELPHPQQPRGAGGPRARTVGLVPIMLEIGTAIPEEPEALEVPLHAVDERGLGALPIEILHETMDALRRKIAEKLKATLLVAPSVRLVEPGGIERAIGESMPSFVSTMIW